MGAARDDARDDAREEREYAVDAATRLRPGLAWGDLRGVLAPLVIGLCLQAACVSNGVDEITPVSRAAELRDRTVLPAAPSQPGIRPERVVVISVAGLRPEHYGAGPLQRGLSSELSVMPALFALATAGTYADTVTPVMPPAPYPAHASIVTGRTPARHGVWGAERMTESGLSSAGMAAADRIQGRTLWHAAREMGVGVAALGWPSTFGAQIDLLLPDAGAPTGPITWYERMQVGATPWLFERLVLFDATLPDVFWPTPEAYDAVVTKAACEIARQPKTPGLWLLYYGQGATSLALAGPGRERGLDGMRRVDAEIEKLLECFAESKLLGVTAFLMVGDRSLTPVHTIAKPNVALEAAGLLTRGPQHLGVPITQWDAVVRSYGGSAVLYGKNERAARLARIALAAQGERTGAFRVVSATELTPLSSDPEAWFGLEAFRGFVLSNSTRGKEIEATDLRGGGGYLPTSAESRVGFVAWGAGIRGATRMPKMRQLDVGPTAAELLGVSLPSADGRPLRGMLGRTPVRTPDATPRSDPRTGLAP